MEDKTKPAFNDSFGYLDTVGWLIKTAHIGSVNDEIYNDWLRSLEQLHIELDPNLKGDDFISLSMLELSKITLTKEHLADERFFLEVLRSKARVNITLDNLRKYHLWLNKLIHKYGLRMLRVNEEQDTIFDE